MAASAVAAMALALQAQSGAGPMPARRPLRNVLPPGAKLFVSPMRWDMDAFIRSEVTRQGLPVRLVESKGDADFVMTGSVMSLGSALSTSREFDVTVAKAAGGRVVWSGEASDYAAFFGSLRNHGAARAARIIVRKLLRSFAP